VVETLWDPRNVNGRPNPGMARERRVGAILPIVKYSVIVLTFDAAFAKLLWLLITAMHSCYALFCLSFLQQSSQLSILFFVYG